MMGRPHVPVDVAPMMTAKPRLTQNSNACLCVWNRPSLLLCISDWREYTFKTAQQIETSCFGLKLAQVDLRRNQRNGPIPVFPQAIGSFHLLFQCCQTGIHSLCAWADEQPDIGWATTTRGEKYSLGNNVAITANSRKLDCRCTKEWRSAEVWRRRKIPTYWTGLA